MQNAGMAVQITIRNVDDEVRERLAALASRRGQSMQQYLLAELQRLASRPSVEEWQAAVRARKSERPVVVDAAKILAHRDAERP